jgi:hypothetical protein
MAFPKQFKIINIEYKNRGWYLSMQIVGMFIGIKNEDIRTRK